MALIDIIKENVVLYDEKFALTQLEKSPAQRRLLNYVIEKNYGPYVGFSHGILPRRKTILQQLGSYENSQTKLFKRGFLTTVGLNEILFFYCTFSKNRWNVPPSLEPTVRNDLNEMKGRKGGIKSWTTLMKSHGGKIPRYYVALITREGVPVYKGIFPNLHCEEKTIQTSMAEQNREGEDRYSF